MLHNQLRQSITNTIAELDTHFPSIYTKDDVARLLNQLVENHDYHVGHYEAGLPSEENQSESCPSPMLQIENTLIELEAAISDSIKDTVEDFDFDEHIELELNGNQINAELEYGTKDSLIDDIVYNTHKLIIELRQKFKKEETEEVE